MQVVAAGGFEEEFSGGGTLGRTWSGKGVEGGELGMDFFFAHSCWRRWLVSSMLRRCGRLLAAKSGHNRREIQGSQLLESLEKEVDAIERYVQDDN